jgi:hypothetical protein
MHPYIEATAKHWGLPATFIQAWYQAEGGTEQTFIKAMQCSVPTCNTFYSAVEIACRSIAHRAFDYAMMHGDFIQYVADKIAPQNVENDPANLNKFWADNVRSIYNGLRV